LTLLFFCIIITDMNKAKLKVLVRALKEIVDELESEVYSDTEAYQTPEEFSAPELDYDEEYEGP